MINFRLCVVLSYEEIGHGYTLVDIFLYFSIISLELDVETRNNSRGTLRKFACQCKARFKKPSSQFRPEYALFPSHPISDLNPKIDTLFQARLYPGTASVG